VRDRGGVRREGRDGSGGPTGVAAIAIDGQMAGIIGIGDDGRAVTPYDSWLDTRCAPYIERMQREAGAEIVRKTGALRASTTAQDPLVEARASRDLRAHRELRAAGGLRGDAPLRPPRRRRVHRRELLHFSGFADTPAGRWDAGLCRTFDVAIAKLPRIVASHEVVGTLAPEPARACGLAAGVPVVAGCGDTAASFLSCGAVRPGVCVDVAGTASVFAATTADFRPTSGHGPELRPVGHARPLAPLCVHQRRGMNLEWFKRDIAGAFGAAGRELPDFDRLNAMAAGVQPSEDDPLFIPHLAGRVSPARPRLRGAWVGLSWNHGPGHLFRAVLEGVALEYGIYLRTLEGLFGPARYARCALPAAARKARCGTGSRPTRSVFR